MGTTKSCGKDEVAWMVVTRTFIIPIRLVQISVHLLISVSGIYSCAKSRRHEYLMEKNYNES